MTALYLSLEVAWKLTPPCLGCSVPCQSLFWEVVRWYSGAWWASVGEDERSGLSCPTSAISVGWGLQKSRCWQKKPWWNSLQKRKHLPLAALCWLLSQDYQPWLSTGRSQPWSLWLMASAMHCSSLLCPSGWTLLLWSCLQLWGRDSGLWLRTKKSWWQHLETPATNVLSGCESKPLGSGIALNCTLGSSAISQSAEQQPLTSVETCGVSVYLH